MSTALLMLLASACGIIVANLYYAQPLAGPISSSIGLAPSAAGLVVTLTQLGYGAGLLLVVPLGDLIENRRLVVLTLTVTTAALLAAGMARNPWVFLAAAFLIGFSAVAAQVLVPFAAHLSPETQRGRAVGSVMTGLLLGIMLSRPIASVLARLWNWHAVYRISAAGMSALIMLLARRLPRRQPASKLSYAALLYSMGQLVLATPTLRRRAIYHAFLFGAFSLYWTTVPLLLAAPAFGLSQGGIALFALIGVAGAIAAPLAGHAADRGWTRPATAAAMLVAAASFLLCRTATDGTTHSLILLCACGVLLDLSVAANLVLGQRAIFMLSAEHRSRLNGLYMAFFFVGGAIGSTAGAWSYVQGGWSRSSLLGCAAALLALGYFATERREGA